MALLTQPWALRSGLPGAVLTWGLRPLRACAEERRPCQLAMVAQALEGEVTATCRLGTGQSSSCLSPSSSEGLGDPVPGPLPWGHLPCPWRWGLGSMRWTGLPSWASCQTGGDQTGPQLVPGGRWAQGCCPAAPEHLQRPLGWPAHRRAWGQGPTLCTFGAPAGQEGGLGPSHSLTPPSQGFPSKAAGGPQREALSRPPYHPPAQGSAVAGGMRQRGGGRVCTEPWLCQAPWGHRGQGPGGGPASSASSNGPSLLPLPTSQPCSPGPGWAADGVTRQGHPSSLRWSFLANREAELPPCMAARPCQAPSREGR